MYISRLSAVVNCRILAVSFILYSTSIMKTATSFFSISFVCKVRKLGLSCLTKTRVCSFCVIMSITVQQYAAMYSSLHFCKLLYMFRVVSPPILSSTYNCNYSIWHWSNRLCYLPLSWCSWNAVL